MTPEYIAFAQETLLENGALDVYTTPIGMKKGRMGIKLTCQCRPNQATEMVRLMFKHTTTLGIRENKFKRYELTRTEQIINGIRIKTAEGYGIKRSKPEYDDIAQIAKKNNTPLSEVNP
jgi:hypothetical protein